MDVEGDGVKEDSREMEHVVCVGDWFARRCERSAHRVALTFNESSYTYAELLDRVEGLADEFADLGVGQGDRVAYLGPNHPAFLVSLFAASRLGAVFVPLNFRFTAPEVEYVVSDAGAKVVVVADSHRELLSGVESGLASVLAADASMGFVSTHRRDRPLVNADDVAIIMYTSGTTGSPKGAMLTHSNLFWNSINAFHILDTLAGDVTLCAAPLFHIGGLNTLTLITLETGGHVVLHESFDPVRVLRDIEAHRVTTMFGVPAMFLFLMQLPDFGSADLTSLRMLMVGGAPCPRLILETYASRGVLIQQGYGLTETAPALTLLEAEFAVDKVGSAGRPLLFVDLEIRDSANRPVLEPGEPGEICVRGPNVMLGYWNRSNETAEVLEEQGWFHTGDIGYLDVDGFLYISDRKKDMIISGGENVYPAEVESVLQSHPAIAEVAVIGAPHERWGETPIAIAVLRDGASLTLDELIEFAGRSLAKYKVPTRLECVDVLPRNPAGKVLKPALRERFNVSSSLGQ